MLTQLRRAAHAKYGWVLILSLLALVMILAACNGDDEGGSTDADSVPTPTLETLDTGPALDVGPGLPGSDTGTEGGAAPDGQRLPGCSDPDAEECPSPLPPALDEAISAEGVAIDYYARYWEAFTGAEAGDDAVIRIVPSEQNKFNLKGTFTVSYADSVDAVLSTLDAPETVEWSAALMGEGVVATVLDDTADPPVATVYGIFGIEDGRAVVFKMIATGPYSLDFHQDLYTAMLDSLVLTGR